MKTILASAFLLVISTNIFASTIDSHSIPVLGAEIEENFSLSSTQTRTAYKKETIPQTCFRAEIVGYRNECAYYPEVRCYETRDSARVCNPVPVYRCQQVANYRQVPYICYQTITTPYDVPDHNVKANFVIKINKAPKEPGSPTDHCEVGFVLEGENLKTTADCKEFLLISTQSKKVDFDQTGAVVHNYDFAVNLLNAEDTIAPLEGGIAEMHMEGHTLVFRTGDLSKNSNIALKLFVEKRHLLKSDETLINRTITSNDYSFEKTNEHFGIVKVNLDKLLGGFNDSKKHVIKVGLSVNLPNGVLLNTKAPVMSVESTLIVNN